MKRPYDFRYHDSERLARLSSDYGLDRRRRSRAPTKKEGAAAALLVGVALGTAWMLGRHFAAQRQAQA